MVVTLIVTIGGCFSFELFFAQPSLTGVMLGFVPSTEILKNQNMLYVEHRHPGRDRHAA